MKVRAALPISLAMLCLSLSAGPAFGLGRDALHGKWAAELTPDDPTAGKDHKDTLTFTRGDLFTSDEMDKAGYPATAYNDRSSPIGVAATFDVTLKNKAGDTAHWQGTATANEMTGSLVVTPKDKPPVNYTFKAEKK